MAAEEVTEIPDALWNEFIPRIKAGIKSEYLKLTDKSTSAADQNVDWMRAFLIYLGVVERAPMRQSSWLRDNLTGLTVLSAVMALAFGGLGAWGISAGGTTGAATSGFLDIAKLFAGALVGAAGAGVVMKR